MFVKIYSYRVDPEKAEEMLSVQKRASRLYAKHVTSRFALFRHRDDPCQWLEMQWYADESAYNDAVSTINADPETPQLWQAFRETLDPTGQTISEDAYEQVWVSKKG